MPVSAFLRDVASQDLGTFEDIGARIPSNFAIFRTFTAKVEIHHLGDADCIRVTCTRGQDRAIRAKPCIIGPALLFNQRSVKVGIKPIPFGRFQDQIFPVENFCWKGLGKVGYWFLGHLCQNDGVVLSRRFRRHWEETSIIPIQGRSSQDISCGVSL